MKMKMSQVRAIVCNLLNASYRVYLSEFYKEQICENALDFNQFEKCVKAELDLIKKEGVDYND